MKIKPFFTVFLTLFLNVASAQNPIEIGVRAGTNIHQNTGQEVFGIFRESELIKYMKFRMEINYSEHHVVGNFNPDAKYVTIPAMLKYQIWHGVTIQTGLQLGVNVSRSKVYTESDRELLEFAGLAGIGYDFNFPLKINFRFVEGIGDIDKGNVSGHHIKSSKYKQISLEYAIFRKQ